MEEQLIIADIKETIRCKCGHSNPAHLDWCEKCALSIRQETSPKADKNNGPESASWEVHGASFIGRRDNNEDAYSIIRTESFHNDEVKMRIILNVADGMGSLSQGEKASQMAIESVARYSTGNFASLDILHEVANRRIWQHSIEAGQELGSTLTTALLSEKECQISWTGDSPLYCIRDNQIIYRTLDHNVPNSLIKEGMITPEEAAKHPEKSVLTKSLGVKGLIHPDIETIEVENGDFILICTDGLSGFIKDEEIIEIITGSGSCEDACNSLISKALENGSNDNITAIVAKLAL